jgi:hypothetical protein
LYPTGDDYLPVVCKWLLSDMGVFPELSKNDQRVVFLFSKSHKKIKRVGVLKPTLFVF